MNSSEQRQGFGHEIMQQFAVEAAGGFPKIDADCSIEELGCDSFLKKRRVDKIFAVYGVKSYGTNTFAHLGLEKSLP